MGYDFKIEDKTLVYLECSCGYKHELDDIYYDLSDKYNYELSNIADQAIMSIFDRGIKHNKSNTAEVIVNFNYPCKKCKKNIKLKVQVEFEYNYEGETMISLDHIEEFWIVDSIIPFKTHNGLYKGHTILNTIRWFIHRWSVLCKEVYIISPFIDEKNWNFLLSTYRNIEEQLHKKTNLSTIITRKFQLVNWKRRSIEKMMKNKLKELENECDKEECYEPYDVCEHIILKKVLSRVIYKKSNFHAKLYCGVFKDKSEIITTSFNLITRELDQYENFYFNCSENNILKKQIKNLLY